MYKIVTYKELHNGIPPEEADDSLKYINSLPRSHFFKACNFCKKEIEYIDSLFIMRSFDAYLIGRVCSIECVNCYILTYTPKIY